MEALTAMPRHEAYKDSGVEWIGEIPSEWRLKPGLVVFTENKRNNKGMKESTVLSLSYGNIVIKPEEKLVGLVPESFETYQLVEPSDIIIRCTDLQNDKVSLRTGLAKDKGIITSAYLNLKVKKGFNSKFLHYYLHALDATKVIYKFGSGLRQNLSFIDFKRLPVFDIPESLQLSIANFLDQKTAQIDEAIAIKEKQIELLKEHKQIIIQKAVTRGLDPNVPMKDSGVDWIGEIPEHWRVLRFKNIFEQSRLPVRKEDGVVTSYRDGQVTLRSNRRIGGYTEAIIEGGYQGIRKGQLVLNSMDAFEGAIGVSDSDGKCTPEYVICNPKFDGVSQDYFALLLREMALAKYIQVICNAVRQRAVRIRFNNLASRFVVFPPKDEQDLIVSYVQSESQKVDSAISQLTSQIKKLKEYKTTLINSAVTGKIKVS